MTMDWGSVGHHEPGLRVCMSIHPEGKSCSIDSVRVFLLGDCIACGDRGLSDARGGGTLTDCIWNVDIVGGYRLSMKNVAPV